MASSIVAARATPPGTGPDEMAGAEEKELTRIVLHHISILINHILKAVEHTIKCIVQDVQNDTSDFLGDYFNLG